MMSRLQPQSPVPNATDFTDPSVGLRLLLARVVHLTALQRDLVLTLRIYHEISKRNDVDDWTEFLRSGDAQRYAEEALQLVEREGQ